MFCNPKNRGANFQWSNFPAIAAHNCKTQIMIADFRPRDTRKFAAHAELVGEKIARTMVEAAGFE